MTATNKESNNLLGVFDNIQVKNEEKITRADLEFCEAQQNEVEKALAALDKWYGVFREAALELSESHPVEFHADGSINHITSYHRNGFYDSDYQRYAFRPFESINAIVEKRKNTVKVFIYNILKYFNKAYSLSVPFPDINENELPIDFAPQYMAYVDLVIAHLVGRSFRETAEDELIRSVQITVHRYSNHALPEARGKSIVFNSLIRYNPYYKECKIDWSESSHLEVLCAGLAFYGQQRLNGDTGIISGFNRENVDITDWHPLSTSPAEYMKFYKNGRVDIRFKDAASAEECFQKLKLNEL
jgi:hypothetical protein